jgi:hypothetical protein
MGCNNILYYGTEGAQIKEHNWRDAETTTRCKPQTVI